MPKSFGDELVTQLKQCLGIELPAELISDVNIALRLADVLESKGYSFSLKDMCPNSMTDTQWQATFVTEDAEFVGKDTQSAVAICRAAVAALESAEVRD